MFWNEKQNTLRKLTKHQTINAIPKGVMFKSKVIKFFNYDKSIKLKIKWM